VFTNYLSKVSKSWKSKVGCATTVSWPTGIGGSKNAGVAAAVAANSGSIGYVSVFYVIQNHLKLAKLKNAAGTYVLPTIGSIESAAQLVKGEKIPANNKISITNPPKSKKFRNAYPLATFTYVLVPQSTSKAGQLKAFITWALGSKAQSSIEKYVFAPMPKSVVTAAKKTLRSIHS
jgi:phosphate transport system substrate-binding protein